MLHRFKVMARAVRRMLARTLRPAGDAPADIPFSAEATLSRLARAQRVLLLVGTAVLAGWLLYKHFPVETVARGDVGVRTNQLTGSVSPSTITKSSVDSTGSQLVRRAGPILKSMSAKPMAIANEKMI